MTDVIEFPRVVSSINALMFATYHLDRDEYMLGEWHNDCYEEFRIFIISS